MEVAAALLDASRKLSSEKDNFKGGSSTGNMSMGSSSSFSSGNEQTGATASSSNTPSSSWLANPWAGERKRTMSDCVSSSEKLSTLTWLGGWSLAPRGDLGSGGQGKEARRPQTRGRGAPRARG